MSDALTNMKALTLWQPWATLIAIGAKRYETRSWRPNYCGPLAIHAAKRLDEDSLHLCFEDPFRSALIAAGFTKIVDLPFGAIIATCRLADCERTEVVRLRVSSSELAFGDYRDGRFAWRLEDIERCDPITVCGKQGIWNWEQKEGLTT